MSQAPESVNTQLKPLSERRWRHDIDLRYRVGSLQLDVQCALTEPWTVLFAPSGAGKTTVLRMIAGLEQPDAGRVVMRSTWPPQEEREFVLTDTVNRISIAPHWRNVRLVSQRPALFPHKTVLDNAIYKFHGLGRSEEERLEMRDYAHSVLELCRVSALRDKMPHQLSGGERQRVALARAIVAGFGHLLMLDEPFTGMDGVLRDDLINDLKKWQAKQGAPILMVTHDLSEVFATGAEVMRMESGRIVAVGPAEVVLAAERERLLGLLSPQERKADPLRG